MGINWKRILISITVLSVVNGIMRLITMLYEIPGDDYYYKWVAALTFIGICISGHFHNRQEKRKRLAEEVARKLAPPFQGYETIQLDSQSIQDLLNKMQAQRSAIHNAAGLPNIGRKIVGGWNIIDKANQKRP